MKKKQKKIQVIKDTKKGFPKDMTKAAAATEPQKPQQEVSTNRDPRIPAAGTILTRKHKGKDIKVKVLENGFEYEGKTYKSISGLAVHIVGGPVSGYVFFKLGAKQ